MIHLLDQDTINKIAAGEVVERPVSVIKELVENAIDAEATAVTVEIEDGGLKMIRITDNGIGMTKEDVGSAFLRHATSKINDASDLDAIHSLGFRGEALASIAAVSMVECMTKTGEAITGIRYQIEGGQEKGLMDIGCPTGTTFLVKDLFYNVPARKKFLKSGKTEANYVSDLISRIALSHPGISFKYVVNGKVRLHTSGNFSLRDCIYQVFGKEYAKHSKEVTYESGQIKISGYVGKPIISRGNRQYEIYYVNGRYIKSRWIQKGIEEGAKDGMMIGQFPFGVFFLEIPFDMVDVNVHPNKMEVRFDQEEEIRHHFREAVRGALSDREPVDKVSLDGRLEKEVEKRIIKEEKKILKEAPEPFEVSRHHKEERSPVQNFGVRKDYHSQSRITSDFNRKPCGTSEVKGEIPTKDITETRVMTSVQESTMVHEQAVYDVSNINARVSRDDSKEVDQHQDKKDQTQNPVQSEKNVEKPRDQLVEKQVQPQQVEVQNLDVFLDKEQIKKHKVIGQAFKTYWIVEYGKELYIVDQHAAHEKVLYEAWVKAVSDLDMPSQLLLEPKVYELSDKEFHVFESFQEDIGNLGFDAEIFGEQTIIVKSVPYLLNTPMQDMDFIHFFDQLVEGEASIRKEDQYLHKLASVACKAAIKGNDKLSEVEYRSLVEQLLNLEDPYHCPHGRPTMIRMSKYELEKKFRRIV